MCVTLLVASLLATAASGVAAAQAAKQQGETAADIAKYNADTQHFAAQDTIARGDVAAEEQRRKVLQVQGQQKAGLGAMGVDTSTGSAALVQEDTVRMGALDVATIRANAARQAWGLENQASIDLMQGAAEKQRGKNLYTGTLLTTGAQVANGYYGYKYASGRPH